MTATHPNRSARRRSAALAGGVIVVGALALGTGSAGAQTLPPISMPGQLPVLCTSNGTQNDLQSSGNAYCGSDSVNLGWAQSGAIESATGIAVSNGPGAHSRSFASGYGTALSSSWGGQAWSFAIGGGIARSGARRADHPRRRRVRRRRDGHQRRRRLRRAGLVCLEPLHRQVLRVPALVGRCAELSRPGITLRGRALHSPTQSAKKAVGTRHT